MSNSTIIGTTSSFYGVATFQSQPIITSTAPANTDNSTNIATTAWANSFLTYTKTQANTWSGDQTFGTANVGILNADTIKGASSTSNMSIGANLNGGSITIGGINSSTKILGPLFADTINSSTSTLNIGNSITTLNLNLGTNLSSGTINIGSSAKTTNISGSSINMSGTVNINTSGSGITTIGNINTSTNLSGTTYISKIDTITPTANTEFYPSITTGNLAIAPYTKANIYIGTSAPAGTNNFILIGTGGATGTTNTYLKGKGIYLADDGGNVGIGNSAGSITINSPLTIGYTTKPTISQIGGISSEYTIQGLPLTTSTANGFVISSFITNGLSIGNYIGNIHIHVNPSQESRKINLFIAQPTNIIVYGYNDAVYNAAGTNADGFDNNLTFFLTVTNSTTSSLVCYLYSANSPSTMTICTLYCMRIG